ncbi:PorV/PorQ family protein [Bacteroidales bacterium OttesenSCG-928-I21]|nr:PorV/PorQ family protein [Bacteroidales bacterium OttesenSCG-928-I21]
MKNLYLILITTLAISFSLISTNLFAGNDQRSGEAGATELLINPWSRSSGWADANVACVSGLEGMYQNIAGMAFTRKIELAFTNTQYLVGSQITINSGGFATRVGGDNGGVIGVSVMAMNFGETEVTTVALPEGGIGTFNPSYSVISLGYARGFSNSIYGGITVKLINESIFNVSGTAFAIDAGIQYVTGVGKDKAGNRHRDNLRFGITMKNVGSTMKYSGDGMSFTGFSPNGTSMTVSQRSQEFELPSLIKIGFSYHIKIYKQSGSNSKYSDDEDEGASSDEPISNHGFVIAANFTSNSYTKDQFHIGLEYGFRNYFFLRAGYAFETGIAQESSTTNVLIGPTAGVSLQIPLSKQHPNVLAFDYSYRFTRNFNGIHTFGARITI